MGFRASRPLTAGGRAARVASALTQLSGNAGRRTGLRAPHGLFADLLHELVVMRGLVAPGAHEHVARLAADLDDRIEVVALAGRTLREDSRHAQPHFRLPNRTLTRSYASAEGTTTR